MFDEQAGFGEGAEPMLVKAVVAEGAVEAFDKGVLHGSAGLDVMKGNPGALSPEVKGLAGKFGAVIHGDGLWEVTAESQSLQEGNDGGTADGGINMDGQTLTGKVIDKGQAAEAAAISKLIVDEVHGPALIGSSGHKQGNAGRTEVTDAACGAGESFLTIDALGALVIDDQAFGFEDIMKNRSAPAWFESRPMAQALTQGGVLTALRLVLQGRTVPAGWAPADSAGGGPESGR